MNRNLFVMPGVEIINCQWMAIKCNITGKQY